MITVQTETTIKETMRVEDIVGDFVTLKKRGINIIGLCPFHNEKTPSFTVSPTKNIYKCFGCGEGGNAIDFLIAHENLNYPEAIKYIANKYGIEVEETEQSQEQIQQKKVQSDLYLVNQFALDYYQKQLHNPQNKHALDYLLNRGFTFETIEQFGIGYSDNVKNSFVLYAVNNNYKLDTLQKAGLVNSYGSDFFRGRVMFPIRNLNGKIVGFGGRTLLTDKKVPKYINTSDTEIYSKSKIPYGVYLAKRSIDKLDSCIIVEGYTDVISLHQANISNVVASSGTSLTVEQAKLIKRFTDNFTFIFDGDEAGIRAGLRALDLVLEQGVNAKVVLLKKGQDPDSLCKQLGAEAFRRYVEDNSHDFIIYKSEYIANHTKNNPIQRFNFLSKVIVSISKIPDELKQAIYIKRCAEILDIDKELLTKELYKITRNQNITYKQQKKAIQQVNKQSQQNTPQARKTGNEKESNIIRLLVKFGGKMIGDESLAMFIINDSEHWIESITNKMHLDILQIAYNELEDDKVVTKELFLNHSNQAIQDYCKALIHEVNDYSDKWEQPLQMQEIPNKNYIKELQYSLDLFKLDRIKVLTKENQAKLKAKKLSQEDMILTLKMQKKLIKMRSEITRKMGIVTLP